MSHGLEFYRDNEKYSIVHLVFCTHMFAFVDKACTALFLCCAQKMKREG